MGVSPVDFLTRYSFRCPRRMRALRRANDGLGSGLSLHPIAGIVCNLGAARLVSTPSRPSFLRPGLARDCHAKGFPDFEQFYIGGFPHEHSSCLV
jgi:hypothetical protein